MTALPNGSRQSYFWTEKSVPDIGEHMIIARWKLTSGMKEEGKKAHDKRFVSAPVLFVNLQKVDGLDFSLWFSTQVLEFQKTKIQAFLTEDLDRGGSGVIPGEYFTLSGLLGLWEEENGVLPSGEEVATWFDAQVEAAISERLLALSGYSEEGEPEENLEKLGKVEKQVNQYRALFVRLVGKEAPDKPNVERLGKSLKLVSKELQPVGKKIERRIEKLLNVGNVPTLADL